VSEEKAVTKGKSNGLGHRFIIDMIPRESTVLDLGCGDGELLSLLAERKGVKGCGVEKNEQAIYRCVASGLSVSNQDIDCGLTDYGDGSFDYVILNQVLQQVIDMEKVLNEALRVGHRVIIGLPNFAYYRARLQIFFRGRTPVTRSLPYMWYDTPNLHFLSLSDFTVYCRDKGLKIEKSVFLDGERQIRLWPNIFAQAGLFLLPGSQTQGANKGG